MWSQAMLIQVVLIHAVSEIYYQMPLKPHSTYILLKTQDTDIEPENDGRLLLLDSMACDLHR
jgi:hypothetical protein